MKVKCDFCGSMIEETENNCPNCGAPLSGVNRTADKQPQTIEELKEWYVEHELPPEEITRFFIGKDYKDPKAFGIYKNENGDFVVYKNKANGERVIRYQGSDEKYAVNELYQRLRAEIVDQKDRNNKKRQKNGKKNYGCTGVICTIIAFIAMIVVTMVIPEGPKDGYYKYQEKEYYNQNSSWYYYDNKTDEWYESEPPAFVKDKEASKKADEYMITDHEGKRFEETTWYDEGYHDNDRGSDSWDNDSRWNSNDSWDSGGTDWDSDW